MSTEIGTLVSRFTAEISGFDAGNKRVETGMKQTAKVVTDSHRQMGTSAKGLRAGMQELSASIGVLQGPLGGVAGRLSSTASLLGSVTGATGGLVAGFGLATAAVAAFATGIYTLATNAASASDKIGDMADKINFSVRTISGLTPAIEAAGGSVEGLVGALGIFDRNMEAAAQGQERLSKLFKGLKIDATDNEVAFRQVASILVKLDGTSQQTALAMELFGRSGKDVLGIIKATGGNVEEFIKQMEALGIVISEEGVKKADAFDKQMIIVQAQLAAVTRQLGEEFMPMVSEAAANLSNNLKNNQGEIRKTIAEIGNLVNAIGGLAQYIRYLSPIILVVETLYRVATDRAQPGGGPGGGPPITAGVPGSIYVPSGTATTRSGAARPLAPFAGGSSALADRAVREPESANKAYADFIRNLLNRGSGGGRGGGKKSDPLAEMKKLAEIQLRITLETLEREEQDIERSYDKRRTTVATYQRALTRLEEEHHKTVLDTLNDEERAIQSSKTLTAGEKKIQLQELELKRIQEANRHRQEENRLEDKIISATRERIALVQTLLQYTTRERIATIEGLERITAMRPRIATEEGRQAAEAGSLTRPRIATDAERAAREQYQAHLAKMRQLASDLTGILDRAVYDGFEGGVKRGIQSLTLGILDLLQNVFLRKLEDILANALGGIGGGGKSGGSIWSQLPGVILNAVGAGFGGGSGSTGGLGSAFAGAFASGGTIPMGQYGVVHDNERVYATPTGAQVIPAAHGKNGSQVVNNYHNTIVLPPDSRGNYSSPPSQRQLSEKLIAALQASQK